MHEKRTLIARATALLLLLFSLPAFSQWDDDFLTPEQAYQLDSQVAGPNRVDLHWSIAKGTYLYRDKTQVEIESGEGVSLDSFQLPPGQNKPNGLRPDGTIGDVEVFHDSLDLQLPLIRSVGSATQITLKVRYQGCADAGICYPPITKRLKMQLPAQSGGVGASSTGADFSLFSPSTPAAAEEPPEFLTPEQAYQFEADVSPRGEISLDWKIADGTFLYRDKLKVEPISTEGITLEPIQLPPGKLKKNGLRPDGSLGDIQVFYKSLRVNLPYQRKSRQSLPLSLKVVYQGCADAGICYPPISKTVDLVLPAVAETETTETIPDALARAQAALDASLTEVTPDSNDAPQASAPAQAQAQVEASEEPLSEQDQIAATLASGSTWLIIASFLGFGVLLAFTPCVFPVIPILSGIIVGQGEKITPMRGFTLSLVYVIAMAAAYTVAGVLAGLFGANLQATLQQPWLLYAFAGLFVLLSLSMFGFYDLQLPSRWQSRLNAISNHQRGGTYYGVAIMGLLSALIVGPCVAPPLAGALIYIGQTGNAVLGGMALFALGIGMGIPLMIIGASAGKLLPKAGSWMDRVKAVFGVGMLAVAIVLLERVVPAAVSMLLWGTLLIVSAIYMGAMRELPIEASGWDRLWKGLGLVMIVYGSLMLVGAAAGGRDTVQPLRGLPLFSATANGGEPGTAATVPGEVRFKRIKSVADLDRELAAAGARGQLAMLDFYADWCVSCKELERYTFSDSRVVQALSGFLLLQADVTADDEVDRALMQGRFGLIGPPGIMFFGTDGSERKNHRLIGFKDADEFLQHVAAVSSR